MARAKALDARELASYYEPGVEAWYGSLAVERRGRVVIPGNHDHNFRLLAFLEMFEPPSPHFHHLDVGCGAGLFAANVLLKHPGATVTAVDISARNLAAAGALATRLGVRERLRLVRGDANHLPFTARPDTILCSEIIEHLPDPGPLLARLRELSRDDTSLYVTVPHIDLKNQGDVMYVRVAPDGTKLAESSDPARVQGPGRLEAYYHHLYTEAEIEARLRDAGFVVGSWRGANLRFPPSFPWVSFGLKTLFRSSRLDGALVRVTRRRFAGNILLKAAPAPRG